MNDEIIIDAVNKYFETLFEYGRTVSDKVSPKEKIIKQELKFIKYLDDNDLYCMFCHEHLVVIVIDYYRQRPVWGCRKDKFTKGMQKIKWLEHCGDCGTKLDLEPTWLADQKEFLSQDNVITCCDKCIGRGNILDQDDMENVKKKVTVN